MSVTSVLVPSDAFFTSGFKQQSWSYETISPTSTTAASAQQSSSSASSTSSSLPALTSSPPVPPAPAASSPSSSAQTSSLQSSGGNYAASASAAASNISSPMYINQPSILAGIVVGCIAILAAIAAAALFLFRRSRRRRNDTAGMARITSRDDMQGHEKRPWKADAEQAGSPTESTIDLRPPPWAERSPVPSTLPSYSFRISRPSRHSSTVRSSATWEDNSEIDVLATDGSSTIRTFSTYSEPTPTATTPTLTTSGSPLTATVGSLSPNATVNPFDHPGYTYPAGSSNATGSRHRPQLSIDTSGVVFEPRTRSRAEHLRDEYMRSQVALNPFDDSAAAGAEQPELYRSPAWSHGNRPSRTVTDAASPWVESGAVIGADGSAESERRGRSRMVMPPTYNKLFPSSGRQPIQ